MPKKKPAVLVRKGSTHVEVFNSGSRTLAELVAALHDYLGATEG